MIEIRITMDESGRFGISGVPANLVVAYGMLEMAKLAVAEQEQRSQRIVQPAIAAPSLLIS